MISDELLRAALIASFEERMALCEREIEENPHRFSLAYKIRKRSIIRLARRYEKTKEPSAERHFMPLRRLALIIAIIAAAVILSVGAYAAYLIINGFVFDMHETYSNVTIDFSEYELKDTITEIYKLSSESGVEYVSSVVDDEMVLSKYQLNGKNIILTQYTKYYVKIGLIANTEDSNIYKISISANDGYVMLRHIENGPDRTSIMWVMNGYVFLISSEKCTRDELIELVDLLTVDYYID